MKTEDIETLDAQIRSALPKPTRPMAPAPWAGGKGALSRWIIKYLPRPQDGVRTYVEPYCGMASVFWALPEPYPVEVLNDLNEEIVRTFRALQDTETFRVLAHRLTWTPYARREWKRALEMLALEREKPGSLTDAEFAWAFLVAYGQSFSGTGSSWSTAISLSTRGMAAVCSQWRGRIALLQHWHDRLTRVQIDCRPALDAIRYWDTEATLFYLDPPYVPDRRKSLNLYHHEMTLEEHEELVGVLLCVRGYAVLSGYPHPVYEPLERAGWRRLDRKTSCHMAMSGRTRASNIRGRGAATRLVPRTESLWLSPRVVEVLQPELM